MEPCDSGPRLKLWRLTVPAKPRPFDLPTTSTKSPSANWSTRILSPTFSEPDASCKRNSLRMRVGGMPPPVFSKCPRIGLVTFFSFGGRSSTKPTCTASYPSGPAADFFCTTTHGPALITVTGVTVPSAAKICVMPIFLPMIPLIIFQFLIGRICPIGLIGPIVTVFQRLCFPHQHQLEDLTSSTHQP